MSKLKELKKSAKKLKAKNRVLSRRNKLREKNRVQKELDRIIWENREKLTPIRNNYETRAESEKVD